MSARKKALFLAVLPLGVLVALLEAIGYWMRDIAPSDSAEARTNVFNETFYEYDRDLIVRLRPNLRSDFKAIRPDLEAAVTTNSDGFRGADFPPPDSDALRVMVLGDSVTFGLGVEDDEAWPAVLEQTLRGVAGDRPVQVRNLAVPGYSTFQGRRMFERHVIAGDFDPHLVLFAFGFNDGYLRPHDDVTTSEGERALHDSAGGRLRTWLVENSWFFAWVWAEGDLAASTPRVPPEQLRANLDAVVDGAGAKGCQLVLIDASLPHTYARDAIAETAAAHGLPSLSFREEFRRRRQLPAEGAWPGGGALRVTFNTHGQPVPPAPDGGPDVEMLLLPRADRRPAARRIELNDDGVDGDPRGDDGWWSCTIELAPGDIPEFGFLIPGFAAALPAMGDPGLLLNSVHLQQPGPRPPEHDGSPPTLELALPNQCPWPELVLLPDPIHASAAGCRVMAGAVADVVQRTDVWRRLVK